MGGKETTHEEEGVDCIIARTDDLTTWMEEEGEGRGRRRREERCEKGSYVEVGSNVITSLPLSQMR